ncbi:DUF4397 domain-containing protein [Mucilaginibacter sp. X4EP1]|uniref:DUF4397 domain-containing protein n=1 Tax=Mucilaginibacter sp. X4EP1 TaxID=2723092 RepID=UPI002169CDCF|nr:DUF4397 domain-containing protein [Mucilaginibacter sp. X4EP1]MCS3813380.1 hypothetical protein [Mucilaginibacter sp. X4EP1]
MKFCRLISRNLFTKVGGLCLISVALSSCLKNNNTYYNPAVALVTVVQAAPDQPSVDFYLDGNIVNQTPIVYGGGITYFKAYTGKRNAIFDATGTGTKIFSDTVTFNQNYVYSLFLANKPGSLEMVKLTDSISQPTGNNANVRFINLSPDAPAVDLGVKGSTVFITNKAYKGYSSFTPILGNTTYTFEVRQAGTNNVLATLPAQNLPSGSVYTIYFYGLANPTNSGDGLTVNIMNNANY